MSATFLVRPVPTPVGTARAHLRAGRGRGLVVLGHGAGGGIDAPDLRACAEALSAAGWRVALVEQPYRVAGRRMPDRAEVLDAAWLATVTAVRRGSRGPLVVGGRSSGARVACRTAVATRADAVVCLAFPLRPPQRLHLSRAAELLGVPLPVLVVQGTRDPFGGPADLPAGPEVRAVAGDHSLRASATEVGGAVREWLDATLPPPRRDG